jgi:hypothetical protein
VKTIDYNKVFIDITVKELFAIISIIFIVLSPFTAYAYSNAQKLEVDSYNFIDKAYYIDLLIKMDNNDEYYTNFNKDNMDRFEFDKTKLSEYTDGDGYISFSCHYKDIYSDIILNKISFNNRVISENSFTLNKDLGQDIYVMKALYDEERSFKVAILDKDGNIIQVSEAFEVFNEKKGYIASAVNYDISNNSFVVDWSRNSVKDSGIKIYNERLVVCIGLFLTASIFYLIYKRI